MVCLLLLRERRKGVLIISFTITLQTNVTVSLQPEVVIIDSDSENMTLTTDYLLDYAPSSVEALSVNGPLGNISINVLFEINTVS